MTPVLVSRLGEKLLTQVAATRRIGMRSPRNQRNHHHIEKTITYRHLNFTMKFKKVRAKRQYYLTVESRFMDTHPLYTDTWLLQTVFFASREGTYKFSKFDSLQMDIR